MTKNKKRIIAFDLGTKFGWYDGKDGGSVKLNPKRRLIEFWDHLADLVPDTTAEVAFESPMGLRGNAIYPLMSLRAVLELHCEGLGIPTHGYSPASVKKSFTGNGRASKDDMKIECSRRGVDPIDDNHADAVAVYNHHILEDRR